MMLEPARPKVPVDKDLKVKLSPYLHLRLHAMKLLYGKPIQQTVTEALEEYFAQDRGRDPQR